MSNALARIQAAAETGESLNWRQLREEIHAEHENAASPTEREQLLAVFAALMDLVERTDIAPENIAEFRETRLKDYHLLVVREALVGENVCTETLDSVTRREVEAGRMSPDDELRVGAINAMVAPHYSRAELEAIAAGKPPTPPQASQTTGWRRFLSKLTGG